MSTEASAASEYTPRELSEADWSGQAVGDLYLEEAQRQHTTQFFDIAACDSEEEEEQWFPEAAEAETNGHRTEAEADHELSGGRMAVNEW